MIKELLEASGGKLLFPLVVVVAGAALVRGAFGLFRSRSQDRRDFLDLFRDWERQSDLWLTVAVRHVFGAYLPADLIRQLMAGPQPGRALLEVGSAWDMLDMDDETGEIRWRRKLHRRAWFRRSAKWISLVLYVVFAVIAGLCALRAYAGGWSFAAPWMLWLYAGSAGVFAARCLVYNTDIAQAHTAAKRWLGI